MNLAQDVGDQNELLFMGFNQDAGCIACGTGRGFIIYNADPFREVFRRIFSNGGIGIVEMLFRCNLLALVGGGRNPRYPTNKVMIWDDLQNKCIGELKFRTEVKAVKLRRDRIVVVLETKVFVYRFKDLKLIDQITTIANPKGLVALCAEPKTNVLAMPGLQRGSIRIELYDISKATLIKAHDAELAQFTLNHDGTRIASASEKGTLIRLWNCHTGEPLRELRRGIDRADIYCLSFNPTSTYLACSSDKGTVHIFSLTKAANKTGGEEREREGGEQPTRSPAPSSSTSSAPPPPSTFTSPPSAGGESQKTMGTMGISFLKGLLPQGMVPKYIESEWSVGQVRGIEGKSVCAFSRDGSRLLIMSSDGQFITAAVEEGECPRLSTSFFLKPSDEGRSGYTGTAGVDSQGGGEEQAWAGARA